MSLVTTAPSYVTGQVVSAAQLNALQDGIQAAWTAYTPTLTAITLGTGGTNLGRYLQVGKHIEFSVLITLGTGGVLTGAPTFTLPVALRSGAKPHFRAMHYDSSAATWYFGATYNESGSTCSIGATSGVIITAMSATAPFTWASGDYISIAGSTYEAV